jgi:hypothetical protein
LEQHPELLEERAAVDPLQRLSVDKDLALVVPQDAEDALQRDRLPRA